MIDKFVFKYNRILFEVSQDFNGSFLFYANFPRSWNKTQGEASPRTRACAACPCDTDRPMANSSETPQHRLM